MDQPDSRLQTTSPNAVVLELGAGPHSAGDVKEDTAKRTAY